MNNCIIENELQAVSAEIENVRRRLHEAADQENGNFLSAKIIQLSQELDILIVKYEHLKKTALI